MYRCFNPNPKAVRVGDCVIRAICGVTGKDWVDVYTSLCTEGLVHGDMPNSNAVWGSYLRGMGYKRSALSDECPDCYTVEQFCKDHPHGKYVLALSGHVVCVKNGDYYDSWDSGKECPAYYWCKEE